jgi:hypothetical protein
MTIDQLMRRVAVQLRTIREALEHPGGGVSLKDAAVLTESALANLHDAAAKLRAVRREIGEPEAKP